MTNWIRIVQQLLNIFCGNNQNQNQHQNQNQNQQQQQQYQQQQQPQSGYGQYPGQQQQQQQAYPPQQPWQQHQQQQQYPQQNVQSWSQAAGGGSSYHQQQQHGQQQHGQQGQHKPNGHGYSRPTGLPAGGVIGPHHAGRLDDNQINQTNEQYVNLRNQARHEGDLAHKCFADSQNAYKSGDGARAKELSNQGKAHQAKQDQLDDQASAWIFTANNDDSPPGTIDLHGLYVKEAIERTEAAISQAQQRGDAEIKVIVGKGLHSQGHVAKIKPAVEDLMRRYNLSAHIDPHNTGVLIVDLTGQTQNGRSRDAGGLIGQMERDQGEGCVIM